MNRSRLFSLRIYRIRIMKKEIFGIKFDNLTMEETLEKIGQFLKSKKQNYIVLPYSEFIVRAQKDKELKNILNEADLCLCEGRGLYFTLKFLGLPIKEEVNGVELIYKIASNEQRTMNSIFLLGGTDNVVKKTANKLGDSIVGFENGYEGLDGAIDKVNKAKPEILIVALGGSSRQEKWIYNNIKKMPSVKVAIGVGGAFDFISGHVKRAPLFLQKSGLEWLWRLTIQPKRIGRISKGVIGLILLTFKSMLLLKKDNLLRDKIAREGHKLYHDLFSSKRIAKDLEIFLNGCVKERIN